MLYCNDQELPVFKYPNGELGIKVEDIRLDPLSDVDLVKLKYVGSDDIIALIFLKGLLDSLGRRVVLEMFYVPYGRMDRSDGVNVFTLKQFCNIINYLKFEAVVVFEPHSDVTPALLDNCIQFPMDVENILSEVLPEEGVYFDIEKDFIILPDAGAQKRFDVPDHRPYVAVGIKHRDPATGRIEILGLYSNDMDKLPGCKAIIIDDICSKGYTFLAIAEQLRAKGVEEVYLVVAHCENSIYDGELFSSGLIDMVFTTNTIIADEAKNDKIKIYDPIEGGFAVE